MKKLLIIALLFVGCDNSTEPELPYKILKWIQIGWWDLYTSSDENYNDGIQYNHQSFYLGGSNYNSCEEAGTVGVGWANWIETPSVIECGWGEDEYWNGIGSNDSFETYYAPNCHSSDDIKSTEIHYYVEQKYIEYVKLGDTEKSVFDIETYENDSVLKCGVFINYEE